MLVRVDRHELYELCVQAPARLVALLQAIHGGEPRVLGEDFCGTAALSRAWVDTIEDGRAIAVDRDPHVLARVKASPRIEVILADVRTATTLERHPVDVLFTGNFSIGELHARADLATYLHRSLARLKPRGVFVCDTYGGASAYRTGAVERWHYARDGARVRYTWEQREADPLTGLVVNALHFRVENPGERGEIVEEITDAFVYRWRLWSAPELRDALIEAGFVSTEVYQDLPDSGGTQVRPVTDPGALRESFIVCIAGRIG